MGRPLGGNNRKFSIEDKIKILKDHYDNALSWKEICRKYNLSSSLIYNWDRKYNEEGRKGLESKRKHNLNIGKYNRHPSEIDKLKKELMKKEIEIARLKKGYMVKGVGAEKEFVTTFDKNTK